MEYLEAFLPTRHYYFKDYLHNRKQYVSFNNSDSVYEKVTCGVPQGSILGPLLFLLYINDINSDLVNQIRLFADDTSLFVVVDNAIMNSAKSLTSDLERIKSWSEQWAVNFNANKSVNV